MQCSLKDYSENISSPPAKMMFNVNACDSRQIPSPSNSNHNKTGNISRKKHQRLRTEGDEQDNIVLARGKKVRKNMNLESEAGSSSSDNSLFVALVTASNLNKDTLYLPQDCTSSNGLHRKCRKIVLTDGGDRSWEMVLRFDKSSNSFYITRGWRHFCDENGKKVGSLFTFELMKKGETPLLTFCPSESTINHKTLANQERYVSLKLTYDSLKHRRLYLPPGFLRENGLDEPRMVTLLGKDGTRSLANLLRENSGRMSLGKGWREFSEANDLKVGEYFTLECIWENATPILNLSNTKSKSAIRQHKGKLSEASEKEYVSAESSYEKEPQRDNNIREKINSSSLIENRLVILALLPQDVKACMLLLPSQFLKANGIDKLGKIVMLGRNEFEWWWGYLLSRDGIVAVGCGWRYFCQANGVKIGESFSLKFMYKYGTTPVLQFCPNSGE